MLPNKAFETLTRHADKRHDFMVRTLGQDAIMEAIEMRAIGEDVVASLDDNDFATYAAQRLDQDEDEPTATPEDAYDEQYASFAHITDELFGNIKGYGLIAADEKGLFLDKTVAAPADALAASIHLFAQVINNSVSVHKSHQIIAGSQSGTTELPVTDEDVEIVHDALERLKLVNESLK